MILGIGNDLVDCRRIEKTLDRFGDRFVQRLFTPQEQARVMRGTNRAAGYAKLFALKEAVLKALGTGLTGGIVWQDIEICRDLNGPPRARLSGIALDICQSQTPVGYEAFFHVSVSDEWPYAQAFAILSAAPLTREQK